MTTAENTPGRVAPDPNGPDTVVFIHGLWMTPRSWKKWAERYEERGYKVLAPAWPGMDGEALSWAFPCGSTRTTCR